MLPQAVRRLRSNESLMFSEGVENYIIAGRKPYFEIPEFRGLFSPDPYHKPVTASASSWIQGK